MCGVEAARCMGKITCDVDQREIIMKIEGWCFVAAPEVLFRKNDAIMKTVY